MRGGFGNAKSIVIWIALASEEVNTRSMRDVMQLAAQ